MSAPAVLPAVDRLGLARAFGQLGGAVEIGLAVPPHPRDEEGMQAAERAKALLGELASLSPRLRLVAEPAPAPLPDLEGDLPVIITLRGGEHGGIHLGGAPAGYVVPILINAILDVSRRETGLAPGTVKVLAELSNAVTLRLLVSASCGGCGAAARLAIQMAVASPHLDTWVLDAAQVPRLGRKIGATRLPAALINDICWVPGAQPELALLARVLVAGT
jgi:alkyl hydroperoxide reductase subunit AhpF